MKEKVYVSKIGGAGLMLNKENLTKLILEILKESKGGTVIFVVSALAGVTRLLGDLFKAFEYRQKKDVDNLLKKFSDIHSEMIERLLEVSPFDFKKSVCTLEEELNSFVYDHIGVPKQKDHAHMLTFGEMYSSFIFACFVGSIVEDCVFLNSRNFIIGTGPDYLNADPVINLTVKNVNQQFENKKGVIITQGYIASHSKDAEEDMVLGYDGSDLTAALISYALLQSGKRNIKLVYWKDIPGVMKNPRNINEGIFPVMTINKYLEFAVTNSVPVRSDSIKLLSGLKSEKLLISIRSFKNLEEIGTIIKHY